MTRPPGAPAPTESAVVVPVPEAEPVVAGLRRRLDVAASWGVPAHVTVLYPFLPPAAIDDAVVARLREVVALAAPFRCAFAACGWFGEEVLWLAPEPTGPFRALTEAVAEAFPGYPPYGGAFDEVVPHLTVGDTGTPAELRAAERRVAAGLPVETSVDRALLLAGTDRPDSWHVLAELPLGGP